MPRDRPALRRREPAVAPGAAAASSLRFIRETMERTGTFTSVSGWGGVAMGATAIVAAFFAHRQTDVWDWAMTWAAAACVGVLVGVWTTWDKARRGGAPLLSGAGRKFVLGLLPALGAGLVLTVAVFAYGVGAAGEDAARRAPVLAASRQVLPGLWLLLYGVGVAGAGMFSVRLVPLMGTLFMLLGTLALIAPAAWGDAFMAVGFGGLNIVFGALIIRRHGG